MNSPLVTKENHGKEESSFVVKYKDDNNPKENPRDLEGI
jgi:hypothetical protein